MSLLLRSNLRTMHFATPLITVALLASTAAPALAAPPPDRSDDLWATVNVCDTADNPNEIGIRGSMPGLGRPAVLWLRFQVQYLSKIDGKWHNIESGADSGFKRIGIASSRVIESGRNFTFLPPAAGGAHTMRGAVTFDWRVKGRSVEKLRRLTEAKHPDTADSDPPGYSAATCQIS